MKQTISSYEKYSLLLNDLITDLYLGKGLQAIADSGSKLLDNPVIILDTSFKALALTTDFHADDESMKHNQSIGYLDANTIHALKASRYLHKVSTSAVPLMNDPTSNEFHDVSSGYGWIDAAIRLHGIVVGYFCVYGANRAFNDDDLFLATKLIQLASMEFQKDSLFLQNHGVRFETLLTDMLQQKLTEENMIQNRLRILSKQLTPPYYMLVTHHSALQKTDTGFAPGLQSKIRHFFPNSISAVYEGNIVLLISSDTQTLSLVLEDEDFLLFMEQNNLNLGVSNRFSKLTESSKYYRQALFCLNLHDDSSSILTNVPSPADKSISSAFVRIHHYCNYTLEHTIALAEASLELHTLCHPGMLELSQSKKSSDKELLETLYFYLIYMKNAEKVASQLHIHKNTLFYRINKIKELLNLDFDSGDDVATVLFSFKILKKLYA